MLNLRESSVLVTGGAGFIGSHVVDALVEREACVRVLDNLSTGKLCNLNRSRDWIDLIEGDVRRLEDCRQACDGVRWVLHLAALGSVPRSMKDPATTMAVNSTGTANLLTAARDAGVERFVHASSSSVYGDSERLPRREGEEGRPLSPYALSKVMSEGLAAMFQRCFGMETVGLRYFNVYGPRQDSCGPYAAVVPRFIVACLSGEPPVIHGDGEQSRDFTYVVDAVNATLLALAVSSSATGRAYNVGGGRAATVNELAALVGTLTNATAEPKHDEPRPGDVRHSSADLTRSSQELGYRPRFDLVSGLRETVRWWKKRVKGDAEGASDAEDLSSRVDAMIRD